MLKKQIEKKAPTDYKEPYEFRLLIGDSIICQRYFRINNFNPLSLNSLELLGTIRECARMIDEDLKSKTRVYTWYIAPLIFETEEKMREYFSNPKNIKKCGHYENIFIKQEGSSEFIWDGEKIIECQKNSEDNTFTAPLTDKDVLSYEFAFYVNGKKIISTMFEGVYPYFIRRNIDLTNTRGRFEGEDISRLGFESYLLHCLVGGRTDLIKKIVKEICYVCSSTEDEYYTTIDTYKTDKKETTYDLDFNNPKKLNNSFAKEIAKAKKYFAGEL